MAARQVKDVSAVATESGVTYTRQTEWIIDGAADLVEITEAAAGSVAYKADGSYIAIFDGTNWVQWTGGEVGEG